MAMYGVDSVKRWERRGGRKGKGGEGRTRDSGTIVSSAIVMSVRTLRCREGQYWFVKD
jgi:hypothetical protein